MKNLVIIAGLIFNFIKKNISNICLFLGAFLIIRYMAIVYSYDVATLGVACMLFLASKVVDIFGTNNVPFSG